MIADKEKPHEPANVPPAPLDLPAWEHDVEAPELEAAPRLANPEVGRPAARPRPKEVKEEPTPPPLLRIVEAMLFMGGAPLTAMRACEAVRGLTADEFQQAIDT